MSIPANTKLLMISTPMSQAHSLDDKLHSCSYRRWYPKIGEDCVMALIYGLNRVIMESRRNNGLYDDEIDEDEEEEDDGEYED